MRQGYAVRHDVNGRRFITNLNDHWGIPWAWEKSRRETTKNLIKRAILNFETHLKIRKSTPEEYNRCPLHG